MTPYNIHTSSRTDGSINYVAGEIVSTGLPLRRRYRNFVCMLTVSIEQNGEQPAQGLCDEGLLGLIKKIFVRKDGGDAIVPLKGIDLRNLRIIKWVGRQTVANTPIDANAAGTYTIMFDYPFQLIGVAQAQDFALDLIQHFDGQGRQIPLPNNVELCVQWGNISDIFNAPGSLSVSSANLSIETDEITYPSNYAGQLPLLRLPHYVENVVRFTESGMLEVDIPRRANAQLVGVIVSQTCRNVGVDFTQLGERVVIKNEEYVPRSSYMRSVVAAQNDARLHDMPGNMLHLPLVYNGDLAHAVSDRFLNEELRLCLPVNIDPDKAGQEHELRVVVEYALDQGVTMDAGGR